MKSLFRSIAISLIGFLAVGNTAAATAATKPAPCTVRNFLVSVGTTGAAAGTAYTPLVFHNHQSNSCTLSGIPNAQPVFGSKKVPVGPAALKNMMSGRGGTVTLAAISGEASVEYAMTTAQNYPTAKCAPKYADGVLITFASWKGTYQRQYFPMPKVLVCTKIASTRIAGVVLGPLGQ